MKIGGHVSIAGGFDKSIDRAVELNANILQTFASSPRSLKTNEFDDEMVEKYLIKKELNKMGDHFFHGVYLINLAHENLEYAQASTESLIFYQKFAKQINGVGTVFHIGSHKGKGFDLVKKQVVNSVEKVLTNTPDGIKLFLENAAGQKGVIGADLKELRYIYDSISSDELREKLMVCYDTQHGFGAGFDIRNEEVVKKTVKEIDNELGFDLIGVIHINDSLVEYDSHKDRHANVGEGEIGTIGFKAFINHIKIKSLPFILEVPGENRSGPRKVDIENLRLLSE
jgi:deoxyribonuclease-4